MSWSDSQGQAIERPVVRKRARGMNLSPSQCLRVRDLLIVFLVEGCGLSIAEAAHVLQRSANLTERHLRRRLNQNPRLFEEFLSAPERFLQK